AWMDLQGPIEVVIGPYEVYEDDLFNYKASFESFVTVVDKPESDKLAIYAKHLPDMERNLPIPDEYKNPNRGTDSPIRVVQELYTAGDARRGVQTAAFNLPNDEVVREQKGSKKVLLKNVMDAKYRMSGNPIAMRVLDPSQRSLMNFDAYFNFILFHELSHGLGPGLIKQPNGERTDVRILLKDTYSSIEECKADVLGIYNIVYAQQNKLLTSFTEEQLYATITGLFFRSLRFGVDEAHGRGTAVQWNWLREAGAIIPNADGTFRVDNDKFRAGIKSLATELLTLQATGDYARAQRLLTKYGVSNAEMDAVNKTLTDIPVDITPVFTAAGEK
ncbi:MAG TPA: peptidase, partial [Thermoanaerobaculia bacterium]